MPDTLDDLLASAAPPAAAHTPDTDAALAAMVTDARRTISLERKRRLTRRAVGSVAVLALVGAGTAAAAGVLPRDSEHNGPGWVGTPETFNVFEWTSTHPVGQVCVEHLAGRGLTDAEVAAIESTLSHPAALLAKDGGAVRNEFLDRGWATDSAEDTAAMDAAYAEVAKLDLAAGRGALRDDQLAGDYMNDRYDEVFANVYWRLILDGIGAGPHNFDEQTPGMKSLSPDTACEIPE